MAALALGVSIGLVLVPPPPPAEMASSGQPTSVPVGTQAFADDRPVDATFRLGDATPLLVQTTGTVTGSIDPATVLASGSVALSVDLRPVVALHTDVPLFRDLTVGDRGADVAALNQELSRLGRAQSSSDEYSSATAQAWESLERDSGISPVTAGLSRADILWLPDTTAVLQTWSATPGTSVTAGGAVGEVRPRLLGVDLSLADGQSLVDGPRVLTLLGLSTPVDDLTAPLPGDFLGQIEATPDFAQLLANAAPCKASGELVLQTPLTVVRVPPSAVFGVDGRQACLQSGNQALPVTIVGSGLGATLVVVPDPSSLTEVAIGAAITATEC